MQSVLTLNAVVGRIDARRIEAAEFQVTMALPLRSNGVVGYVRLMFQKKKKQLSIKEVVFAFQMLYLQLFVDRNVHFFSQE